MTFESLAYYLKCISIFLAIVKDVKNLAKDVIRANDIK